MKNKITIAAIMLMAGILLTACAVGENDDEGGSLAAPYGLTAGASSSTSITLNWTTVSGAAKYKIYTSVTSTGIYNYVDETEYNTYLASGLVPNSTYYYKVSSVDKKGIEGSQSTYAVATTQPPVEYTVTFHVNGGSGLTPSAQKGNAGSSITLPNGSGLTKSDFIFNGWNTNAAGTGIPYSTGSSYTVSGDVTLYAMWSDTPVYIVTFNTNGGSGTVPSPLAGNADSGIILPSGSELSKSGFVFGGWNTNVSGTGTNYYAGSSYTPISTVTLYAKWESESSGGEWISPPGFTLTDKLLWLQGNAESDSKYTLDVNANTSLGPQTLAYTGKNNITIRLRGVGAKPTVSLSSSGAMFAIGIGVTLVLDNVTLQGRTYYSTNDVLVKVNNAGTLIINEGSTITGNERGGVYVGVNGIFIMNGGTISSNDSSDGGGVSVVGGTFTMNSGTISNNTSNNGGGVYVNNGIFFMNGGSISGNIVSNTSSNSYGGGVSVGASGIFNMSNGNIFGNTSSFSSSYYIRNSCGGGVYVSGTFNMIGGTISGNSVSSSITNFYGGGVYVDGTFTKTGGTIYGFSIGDSNNNVANSGTVSYRGHAVYAYHSSTIWKGKDTTAGTGVNLSFNGSTGEFTGTWDF